MSGFWFTVAEISPADEAWGEGVFLIGPPGDASGGLVEGDAVAVPVDGGGNVVTRCLGFPLLNLGGDRLGWVSLHLDLPASTRIVIGERVTKVEAGRG